MPTLQRLIWHAALATLGLYWAAMFLATHVPSSVAATPGVGDKALHFWAYAVLALLLASAASLCRRLTWANYAFLFAVAAAYGAADEFSQMLVPTRQADLRDWLADGLGIAAGLATHRLALAVVGTLRTRPASV